MRIRIGEIRKIIRRVIKENPAGAAVAADPTDVKGFYPYDLERGTDIHGFWYKSPGRTAGSDGDPGRPADASEYIGLKPKETSSEQTDEPAIGADQEVVDNAADEISEK